MEKLQSLLAFILYNQQKVTMIQTGTHKIKAIRRRKSRGIFGKFVSVTRGQTKKFKFLNEMFGIKPEI